MIVVFWLIFPVLSLFITKRDVITDCRIIGCWWDFFFLQNHPQWKLRKFWLYSPSPGTIAFGFWPWELWYTYIKNLLDTHVLCLVTKPLRIDFKKPYYSNTDILYNTYNILNLEKSHAKEVLINLYFYKFESVGFNHNYSTRQIRYLVLRLNKYNTEFGKKDPFNIGIQLCMKYDIPIKQLLFYNDYERYKKYIEYKMNICL